jgi:multidrug efflux pump subunit AcrA (membrane-fusion protein)
MSTQVVRRGSFESESEMLPQDPPPWIIRASARLLIAIFFVALLAAVVVRLPETVHCPFVLVPQNGADPIQSPRLAVVSKVAVSEGQTVAKGAELFVLRSDEIRGFDTQLRTLTEDLHVHEESLTRADASYISQLEIRTAEIAQAESEVKFREKHAASSRDLVARMEKLLKRGGISDVEVIHLRLDAAASEKDFSVAQRTLQQVAAERQKLESDHARQRGEEVSEIEKMKLKINALKADLENSQQNMLTIRAPYPAMVVSLAQRNPGSVVQSGQELCQLSALEGKPQARLAVSEAGYPKLAVGQRARFFFEAYPYQRYGAVDAKVEWISPTAVTSSEGSHFVVLASIDENTRTGRRFALPLRVGMRGEARIVVGRRRLIEYMFEPIRQLKENMRE